MHNYPSLRNYAGGPAGGDMHAYAGAHQPMSGVPSSVSQPQHRYNNSSYASATQNPPHSRSRREAQGPLVITTTPVRSHADPSASLHDDIHPYALPPQPRGSGHASRSPSAAASAQPMNSAALLDDIKRTSDLIVEFRRLKAQGGSREEREHLRRQVHALKSSQAAALLMEQAKAVGHEGEGGAWRRTGSQQHRANREGQDSRQPGHPAVELFSSRDDRRQKQHQHTVQAGRPATAPATQRGQHSLPLHPLAAASSSEERAAQGGAHYHAADTSRQLATVPRAPIAAWVHEEERAWRSMCFAASLAEHHIRKEIIRKWEKKWWKLWAQFREGRVEICVAPRRSQTTVASAEPTTRWSHREELTGGEPKILVPPSDARTSGTGQLEAHPSAKDDAKLKAEEEARLQVEEEARRQAKKQARARAEEEARLQAEEEAKAKAEEEARLEAEEEARLKAEEDARLKAEEEARLQAEEEAKAEEEARLKAEEEARLEAEEEARLKAEEEARLQAEEDARLKAEEEARLQAEEEAKAEEEARLKAQEEARLQAEEEARLKAEEEARLKAEEEARLEAEEEARLQAEEEARLEAEEEARLQAEEAARLQADEDARLQAEEESELRGAYRDSVIKCCDALLSSLIAEAANSLDDAPIPKSDEEVRDDADSVSTGSARDIIATETDTASSLDESKEEAVNKDVTEEEQPAQEVDTEETRHDGHEDVTQAVLSVSEEVIEVFIGGAARIAEECAVAVAEETSARGHIAADEEMEWADLVKSVEQMRAEMAVQEAVPTGEDTAASVESSMPAEDDEAMHEELEGSSTSEKSAEKTAEAQEVLSEEDGDASEASEPPRLRDPNEVLDSCNALFIDLFQAALSDALVMHSKACADAEAEREESRGLLCNEEKEVRDAVLSAEEDSHRDLLDLITSGHREAKLLETERVTIQAIETLHQQEVEGRSAVAQSEEDAYQDTLSSMMIERDEIAATEAEAALADVDNESAAEDKAAQEPSYIEDGIGSEDGAHTESTQSLSQYPATEGETPHDTKAEMSALLAFADSFIDESIALAVTSVEVPTPLPASPFTPDALDESPEKEVPSAVDEATIEDSQDLGNSASAVTLDEVPVDTAAGDAEVLGDDSLMPPPPPPPAAAPAASGPISPHALAEAADAIVGGLIRDASESAGAEVRTELPTLKKPEEPTSTEPAPLCAAPTPQAGKNIADIDAGNAITSFILQDAGRSIMRVHEGMPDPQQQLTYQHVQRVLMDGMTAALKGANVRAVPDNVDAGSSTPTDTGALPTDWRLAVEAVADRVANDFMQHTAAMMLRKQAEQVLYTPCFQTTVQATQAAIATVDPLQLFSPATLSARDIAFLFSYYMELFKKGRAAANVAITSPDVMRFSQSVVSRNLFAPIPASNSEYLGSPIAPPLGVASPTSVYPTRVNPQPDWGGSTDVRRAGMTSVVFDHTLNNILDDMVADTVEWMGTLLMS